MKHFSVSFILPRHIVSVLHYLLRFDNIRRNVDEFFLYETNFIHLSRLMDRKLAIAYRVKFENDVIGCLLAFRKENRLFGHFLFRTYPELSVTKMALNIIPRMIRYFDRKKIWVAQVIGEILSWNHAAIRVCRQCGCVEEEKSSLSTEEDKQITRMIFEVPLNMHLPGCRQIDDAMVDDEVEIHEG